MTVEPGTAEIAQREVVVALGPVLFAYDGSELAAFAIEQAGRQLATARDALVVCVWQPADVGFSPVEGQHFDAANATEVHQAAEETAAYGASLAETAGFRPRALAVEAAPSWKGIVQTARDRNASLIMVGSVAAAVVAHAESPVLLVHPRA
jgi:nucleotide-binding universal stress UspA family protein